MAVIVVIDDNTPIRQMVRRILSKDGHEVIEAADGRVVRKLLEKHRPDLVITDIFMPNSDGIEVIRQTRNASPKTPIIAMTGSNPIREELYLRAASELGADATIKKPFRVGEMREIVQRLLANPPSEKASGG
ncbi:MAG TPA: response regulator [Stellaceae bacterium]|jgi:CheY-like chemotaxis protein|nr:response regulator [Stellaceae bacterium]